MDICRLPCLDAYIVTTRQPSAAPSAAQVLSRFRAGALAGGSNRRDEDKSSKLVEQFSQLQARRVKKVLLLCSDYDSYTFEEETLLSEAVYQEYATLNLRTPPQIERVSTPEMALERLQEVPLLAHFGASRPPSSWSTALISFPIPYPTSQPPPAASTKAHTLAVLERVRTLVVHFPMHMIPL